MEQPFEQGPPPTARDTSSDEWLWGWDPTPGIVSVHASLDGSASIWRRLTDANTLVREDVRFRPWLLVAHLDDLPADLPGLDARALEGPGALRHLVSSDDGRVLIAAILRRASTRLSRHVASLKEMERLEPGTMLSLPPEEQYLVSTGRTYFKGLSFDHLHRLQFDLETTGLDPRSDRIFMISLRYPNGETEVLEAQSDTDAAEAELIGRLSERVRLADPDVIENHNLHGFDLPFLDQRARLLRIPLALGRTKDPRLRTRATRRRTSYSSSAGAGPRGPGTPWPDDRPVRFVAPGRELIDTMDAVRRYDFSTRELPGHGLKAVARHFGIARPDRVYITGSEIYHTYRSDPARVRRYATDDVDEVAGLSRLLGGAAYALAQMVPRRYERLADAGPATGVIDPLLVRAYLRAGMAIPAHAEGDGTPHSGASLYLFASGVAHRIVKADVASLYPSLMRTYRIGPARDRLGALLALVETLVEARLEAKKRARLAPPGSPERHTNEAMSAAFKIVVNSAYGYLGAGGLTRFADVHAANEVTRRGREVLALLCQELAARGVTLIEADTDGVYFSVPATWTNTDEERVVADVGALLPPLIHLELEGRYASMLSHEPKNYALLDATGQLHLKGVAFRSSRSEPFGETFLRNAITRLLRDDIVGIRSYYLETIRALRHRTISTHDVSSRVRLTKSPREYAVTRAKRSELPYEALLAAGRTTWRVGERIRVYRKQNGTGGIVRSASDPDPRDYDTDYYVQLLRTTYAERLSRAFAPADFSAMFGDGDQLSLFSPSLESIHTTLTILSAPERTVVR